MGPKENGARENHGVKNQSSQMMSTLRKVISGVIVSRFRSKAIEEIPWYFP